MDLRVSRFDQWVCKLRVSHVTGNDVSDPQLMHVPVASIYVRQWIK